MGYVVGDVGIVWESRERGGRMCEAARYVVWLLGDMVVVVNIAGIGARRSW